MELVSDYRESHINKLLTEKKIPFKSDTLNVGDFKIVYNETVKTIIERKTISDLVSSIIDGRYKEQSLRLGSLEKLHAHNIIYIIEGDLNTYKPRTRIKCDAIKSCMFALTYYKGFIVVNTKSKEETTDYIKYVFDKISKHPNDEPYSENNCKEDYVNVVKKVKRDNINKENINILMLSQIPGISANIAKSILNKFTFKQLVNGDFENCDIIYIDSTRKIPKKSLVIIRDFLSSI
jgi:ERCC4-type nuclease